nr:immunoglobulin heavy chain junction region [Macaca mulatta]MOX40865.1 immunoglobulin heavy chain junction region [Macaca mulatta]
CARAPGAIAAGEPFDYW